MREERGEGESRRGGKYGVGGCSHPLQLLVVLGVGEDEHVEAGVGGRQAAPLPPAPADLGGGG